MMHPKFGKRPSGERLQRIKESVNYRDGKFQNQSHTPQLTQAFTTALYDYLFGKSKESKPKGSVPTKEVDWEILQGEAPQLVWFGHSSYLLQLEGQVLLVDPVLSGSASPIPGGTRAFKGTDIVRPADLPAIDVLFITHDHYDHMDYQTLKAIKDKVKYVICGLGVGEHLEYWGYRPQQIIERDWWETVQLDNGFKVTLAPARHFSGRSIFAANTLWTSFVLEGRKQKIFIGGDSGYDTHFKEIGDKFGPFDLAILENGQYDHSWKYIHMMPEEVVQAAKDLQAGVLFPVHSAKFVLANHAWTEPLTRITQACLKENMPLITPMIGESVNLETMDGQPTYWWRN
ncbi:MBL fold metallo-hydrolase [Myroides sp. DF42-4-2]|nr:MBL fold metallo-hydrolase [Myroides sp. DF42-4-2]MDM1408296.1 MBL fold metallo-hydrolase [Myroides sp. DF42-4-2]